MRPILLLFLLSSICFFDNSSAQSIKYFYYTYDSSKERYENFDSGYVDTFSIRQTKFRIRSVIDSENIFVLEKFKTKWILIDTFYARQCEYFLHDINNDGYPDFYADNRWQQLIYLFDITRNTFIKCGYFSTDDCDSLHAILLSSNLFYDTFDNKRDNWWSYLYTIKNNVRYNLGIIEYKFGIGEKSRLKPKFLSVRKIYNDTTQKELIKITGIDFHKFDIKKYWQKNFQKFYPNIAMKPNEIYIMYEPDFD